MKVSLDWLNRYLDRPCDAAEAEEALTAVGFPEDGRDNHVLPDGGVDPVIDFEVTSNRGDCLSHVGLARELAAATGRTLQRPACGEPPASKTPVTELTRVDNDAIDLCPLYTARGITGVKVGPSPDWLAGRLEAIGLRAVNNVVDVTNFVLHELGQPLHAFDLGKLAEKRIVVRRANAGEQFVAIDGSKHDLRDDMLVIADGKRPVAVAGVMGGLDSEVGDNTTDLLIESAIFAPLSVRRTSRTLKLSSDSSFRFERGVDPLGVDAASRRACELILDLAGGTLADGVIATGRELPEPHEVSMRIAHCNALLGVELAAREQAEHLDRLGLQPRINGDAITCAIPTYRLDLHREIDLIEEIARHHGFDHIPVQEKIHIVTRPPQRQTRARQELSRVLVGHGYHETITFSFVSPKLGEPFLPDDTRPVILDDERRKAEPMLRPSLLPSLLICRKANQDLGNTGVRLFEAAATWASSNGAIVEGNRLALLRDAEDGDTAVRELRGTLEELIETLGGPAARRNVSIEPMEDSRCGPAAKIRLNQQDIGRMGLVDEQTCGLFGLQIAVAAAELDVDALIELYPPKRTVGDLPRFPGIERDLSIIVDETVPWQQVEHTIRDTSPPLLEELRFLGTYRGKPIPKGRKSVSLRMLFRDPARTLRHEQVDPQVNAVIEALRKSVNAELRS